MSKKTEWPQEPASQKPERSIYQKPILTLLGHIEPMMGSSDIGLPPDPPAHDPDPSF